MGWNLGEEVKFHKAIELPRRKLVLMSKAVEERYFKKLGCRNFRSASLDCGFWIKVCIQYYLCKCAIGEEALVVAIVTEIVKSLVGVFNCNLCAERIIEEDVCHSTV